MFTKTFDEMTIGEKYTSRGRTITEADVVNFCYLTGNWLEIHSNTEFCKTTEFGERIVQGSLVFSIIAGLVEWDPTVIIAFYGVDKIRFLSPVKIGDTIYVKGEVTDKQAKDESRGVVTGEIKVLNQRDELVQVAIFKLLVRRTRLPRYR